MLRVLTVDDSRAVRSIITKQLEGLQLEVDEAEDGQQGLDRLARASVDLILLDVTMPVMDGPTMLNALRGTGNKTPVIMLTSESKRSVVADAIRLGISDYILKPFKPEELRGKVCAALKLSEKAQAPAPGAVEAAAPKGAVDVMVIDDMENVSKRLRTLLPAHLTLESHTTGAAAIAACRERAARVVLIDTEIPNTDSVVLASQLKVLQPQAAIVALALKGATDPTPSLKARGFPDVLFKPFTAEGLEDFTLKFFDNQQLLLREENLVKVGAFAGRDDRLPQYFSRLTGMFPAALEAIASACFEDAVVDLSHVPLVPDRLPKLVAVAAAKAQTLGLQMRVVGSAEHQRALAGFEETRKLPMFRSLDEARAA